MTDMSFFMQLVQERLDHGFPYTHSQRLLIHELKAFENLVEAEKSQYGSAWTPDFEIRLALIDQAMLSSFESLLC